MKQAGAPRPVLFYFSCCLSTLLFVLSIPQARADQLYASIRGAGDPDPSGAVLAEANITVTNVKPPAFHARPWSGADGSYNFQQLAIGDYNLRAEKAGFEAFVANKIHLDVNQTYVQPVQMTLGAVNQEVNVDANQVQVESTTPQLGTVIGAQQIVNLPLIGRNWVQLQTLQPGVQGASDHYGVSSVGSRLLDERR